MAQVLNGPIHALLLQLLIAGLTAAGGVVVPRATRWIDAHATARQRSVLAAAAHDAVLWAERFAGPAGDAKFQAATRAVNRALGRWGFTLADVEGAVQAAWAAATKDGLLNPPRTAPAPAPEPAKG